MAAHLARHQNALHGPKKRAAKGKKRRAKVKVKGSRKVGRPKGRVVRRRVGVASVGGGAAQLINGMQAYHRDLLGRRESIEAEIAAIGSAIEAMGAVRAPATVRAKRGRPAGRPARAGSLKSYIVKVLGQRSTAMSPKDIAARILRSGYKSKAKDLTKAVSNTLPQLRKVKKVGFGMYKI
jgi:hypothetical protein